MLHMRIVTIITVKLIICCRLVKVKVTFQSIKFFMEPAILLSLLILLSNSQRIFVNLQDCVNSKLLWLWISLQFHTFMQLTSQKLPEQIAQSWEGLRLLLFAITGFARLEEYLTLSNNDFKHIYWQDSSEMI